MRLTIKLVILLSLFISGLILPHKATHAVICEELSPNIITSNLPDCISIPKSNCGGIPEFKNTCEEDVFYTNVECWDGGHVGFYESDGFKILNDKISVSRKYYSNFTIGIDEDLKDYKGKSYYARINYAGGGWPPCRLKDEYIDTQNKTVTIIFEKGNEKYEVVAGISLPEYESNDLRHVILIIVNVILGFLGILSVGLISYAVLSYIIKTIKKGMVNRQKINSENAITNFKVEKRCLTIGILLFIFNFIIYAVVFFSF
ncbi:hypothetical protein KKD19_00555 [Patescibacteria group bacterium]|nr:hypothetical protein [Patescibacteria group bacterium]MBU4511723.1 hypothetical protein [Patescibacteria group bacterium]MCG2692838.1 hypothetical protein [Candidatus Parcubacteria bacterium]